MRSAILFFTLICVAAFASFGQQSTTKESNKRILRPIQQNGRWGYIDDTSTKDGALKVTIYVALEMKNIIVNARLENSARSITQRIGNISFDVPDTLVEVPPDYKKN